jgi:hypothetical protein
MTMMLVVVLVFVCVVTVLDVTMKRVAMILD